MHSTLSASAKYSRACELQNDWSTDQLGPLCGDLQPSWHALDETAHGQPLATFRGEPCSGPWCLPAQVTLFELTFTLKRRWASLPARQWFHGPQRGDVQLVPCLVADIDACTEKLSPQSQLRCRRLPQGLLRLLIPQDCSVASAVLFMSILILQRALSTCLWG